MPYGLTPNYTSLRTHATEGDTLVRSQVLGLDVHSSLSLSPHTQGPPAPCELLLGYWMQPCPRWADTMAGEQGALVVAIVTVPCATQRLWKGAGPFFFPFSPIFLTQYLVCTTRIP